MSGGVLSPLLWPTPTFETFTVPVFCRSVVRRDAVHEMHNTPWLYTETL